MMISASSPNLITQAVESPPSYATIYNNNIPAAAINDTRHMSMPNIVDAQRAANNNGLGFANPAPYPRTAPCPQPCPYPEPKQTSQIPVPSSILPNSFPLLQQPMQQYAPQSVQQPIQVQPVQMQPVQVQPVQVQPVQVQPVQVQPVQMQPPQAPMQITIQNKADNTNKNANIIAGRRYCPRCDAVLIRQLNPYIVATIVVIGLLLSPFGWLLFFILCTQAARSWKCPVCHYESSLFNCSGPGARRASMVKLRETKDSFDHLESESESLRRLAVFSVAISTVTIVSCITIIPICYQHVQYLHNTITTEVAYLKNQNKNLYEATIKVRYAREGRDLSVEAAHRTRLKRGGKEAGNETNELEIDELIPVVFSEHNSSKAEKHQEQCFCKYGPPGPPGDPGKDGKDGKDGQPGKAGRPGKDATTRQTYLACIQECPPGPPGDVGPPGEKGPRGYPGEKGNRGPPGKSGVRGPEGKMGCAGPQGPQGKPGKKGRPGKIIIRIGQSGPQGRPGVMGPRGPPGPQGAPGREGPRGPRGPRGDTGNRGPPGKDGPRGLPGPRGEPGWKRACSHCPVPEVQSSLSDDTFSNSKT